MSLFTPNLTALAYLVAAILFILALRGLSSPESARRGNLFGILGMGLAVVTTVLSPQITSYDWIIYGLVLGGILGFLIAQRIAMTAMPQLVAAFHSLVGLASVLVASAAFLSPDSYGITNMAGEIIVISRIEMSLGSAVGAITFSGSLIAFLKLQGLMSGVPIVFRGQYLINIILGLIVFIAIGLFAWQSYASIFGLHIFWWLTAIAFLFGFFLIIPIGGADMPVVISMLNSYSGWAAAGIGFTLKNDALIITGALVGSSGAILSYVMCKGMNRSLMNVILGGFGGAGQTSAAVGSEKKSVKQGSADDAAFILKNASSVIIVPGYGMAVAHAQHAVRELADKLKNYGVKVTYAIHPVAGRMPGHMNVLLAEANVPYDEVYELDDINNQFSATDVVYVIGANDVTNPAAKTNPKSPIYGMPILDVEKAKTVLFVKRSLASGYAGVENELFFRENTMMLFGDAKTMTEGILKALE